MLDIIRNLVASIFGKILLGIMVLSFALWGVGDILNSGNAQLAAKVGSQKITLDEFYYEFQRSIDEFNATLEKKITLAEAYKDNIHTLVINEMIYDKMVKEYADKNNIYVSDNILKDVIKSMSQFQNEDGTFNKILYEYSILNTFPSEKVFLDNVRILYLKAHLFDLFKSDIELNKDIYNLILKYETETRDFDFFTINNMPFDPPSTTDLELEKFYNKNKEKYELPKSIKIDLLEINYNEFANEISIDKSILKEKYQENLSSYVIPETRDIEFVRFDNELDSMKFRKVFIKSSDDEVKKYNEDNNISLNKIKDLSFNDFNEILSDNIFNLNINEISNPINAEELGFYVVKVTAINKKKITSFEDVSSEIEDELVQNEAFDVFDEVVNIANDLYNSGYEMDEISDEINIKIKKNINFNDISSSINDIEFLLEINNEKKGYQSDLYLDETKAMMIHIINIKNSYIPELNEIREKVQGDFLKNMKEQFLDKMLTDIALEIKPDGSDGFYKYAYSNGAKLEKIINVKRSVPINELNEETQKQLFKIEKNNILMFKKNENFGILLLTNINRTQEDEQFSSLIKNNINNNYDSTVSKILEKEIINNIEYQIFSQNINNLF